MDNKKMVWLQLSWRRGDAAFSRADPALGRGEDNARARPVHNAIALKHTAARSGDARRKIATIPSPGYTAHLSQKPHFPSL